MDVSPLLGRPHLSVVSRDADHELARIQEIIECKVLVDGRVELEELLSQLLVHEHEAARTPKTLDLIGHSAAGDSLVLLGNWVIDASRPAVTAFFRELADNNVLPRLGIYAVRLLGCHTAETATGRATICALSSILGLEVHGTRHLIYSAHYDRGGFRDDCTHALVCSSDLRHETVERSTRLQGTTYPRMLDIDCLPATPLVGREHVWPRRIADPETAKIFLRLVRRHHGAHMPGLLTEPSCEIALPSPKPNWYHLAQVLLDGEFVRVYPDGNHNPGIVFPVEDPPALRALIHELPVAPPSSKYGS